MSSTSRREQSRSATPSSSSSRHKNYRFKSYLEANTQERARFDAMQDHVADKIAEVMASFREEKLVVHPHRTPPAEPITEAEVKADAQSRVEPKPAERPAVAQAVARPAPAPLYKAPRPMWPWYVGGLVAAMLVMVWFDVRSAMDTEAPTQQASTGAVVSAAPSSEPVVPEPIDAAAAVVTLSEPVPASPGPVAARMEPVRLDAADTTAQKPRQQAPARKPPKPRGAPQTDHYSEDLTGLLQGQ